MSPLAKLALTSLPGVSLQLVGMGWPFRPGWPEVTLAIGVTLMAVGTLATVFALERYVVDLGRRDTWALLGLLGPLGLLGVSLLRPGRTPAANGRSPGNARGGSAEPRPNVERGLGDEGPRSNVERAAGLALSALLAASAVWAAAKWLEGPNAQPLATPETLQRNEQRAFERLRSIANAQRQYAERDWDGDGEKVYAAFTVHLWRSVDARGNPVPVDLISRELGFAMVPELAVDGYVYRSLQWRAGAPDDSGLRNPASSAPRKRIHPEQSWAVVAEPVEARRTGMLMLVVDTSQTIWAMPRGTAELEALPIDPEAHGWATIASPEGLAVIQQAMTYPTAELSKRD